MFKITYFRAILALFVIVLLALHAAFLFFSSSSTAPMDKKNNRIPRSSAFIDPSSYSSTSSSPSTTLPSSSSSSSSSNLTTEIVANKLQLLSSTLMALNNELKTIAKEKKESRNEPSTNALATSQTVSISTEPTKLSHLRTQKKAILFTMDSISTYEENSHKGGAAGKLQTSF